MLRIADAAALVSALAAATVGFAQDRVESRGGIAISKGNIYNSRLTVGASVSELKALIATSGAPLRSLTKEQQRDIGRLQATLGLREGQLRMFLALLGYKKVPDDRLEETLIDIAARFKALQESVAKTAVASPRIAELREKAQAALNADKPRLDEAAALLAEIQALQLREAQPHLTVLAQTAGQQGDTARAQLKYKEAAQHYAEAVRYAADGAARVGYLRAQADVLLSQGYIFKDAEAGRASVELWRELATLTPRQPTGEWIAAHLSLAGALNTFGLRAGAAPLKEAVGIYEQVLLEQPRERAPLDWAKTKAEMGLAVARLARADPASARLEDAADAIEQALQVITPANAPGDWPMLQFNLGGIQSDLGVRETGAGRLEKAVAALRRCLTMWTEKTEPLFSGVAQQKLGDALLLMGERGAPAARFEEASEAYDKAAKLYAPYSSMFAVEAMLKAALSEALLAERNRDAGRLDGLIAAIAGIRPKLDGSNGEPTVQLADDVLARMKRIRAGLK